MKNTKQDNFANQLQITQKTNDLKYRLRLNSIQQKTNIKHKQNEELIK